LPLPFLFPAVKIRQEGRGKPYPYTRKAGFGKNISMWERFFNWQSDMDWTWGPFLALRPARDVPMRPWVWVRLFAALSLAGALLIVLVGVVCVLGPKVAAWQRWVVPAGAAETLATLSAMTSDTGFRLAAAGIVLSLPLLFFGFSLPFHLAWNRRALRLAQGSHPAAQESVTEETPPEIWPPAPNRF